MNLIPRNSLFDFDSIFDNVLMPIPGLQSSIQGTFSPRVDIKENDDHFEITAELPGVNKEDLNVSLHDGVLSIEAETRSEDKEEKDGKIIRQERRYGKFIRSFNVGDSINEKDIKAAFKDGILTLKAPKLEEKKAERKRIEVA